MCLLASFILFFHFDLIFQSITFWSWQEHIHHFILKLVIVSLFTLTTVQSFPGSCLSNLSENDRGFNLHNQYSQGMDQRKLIGKMAGFFEDIFHVCNPTCISILCVLLPLEYSSRKKSPNTTTWSHNIYFFSTYYEVQIYFTTATDCKTDDKTYISFNEFLQTLQI